MTSMTRSSNFHNLQNQVDKAYQQRRKTDMSGGFKLLSKNQKKNEASRDSVAESLNNDENVERSNSQDVL